MYYKNERYINTFTFMLFTFLIVEPVTINSDSFLTTTYKLCSNLTNRQTNTS